jgi:hypothetical protein
MNYFIDDRGFNKSGRRSSRDISFEYKIYIALNCNEMEARNVCKYYHQTYFKCYLRYLIINHFTVALNNRNPFGTTARRSPSRKTNFIVLEIISVNGRAINNMTLGPVIIQKLWESIEEDPLSLKCYIVEVSLLQIV